MVSALGWQHGGPSPSLGRAGSGLEKMLDDGGQVRGPPSFLSLHSAFFTSVNSLRVGLKTDIGSGMVQKIVLFILKVRCKRKHAWGALGAEAVMKCRPDDWLLLAGVVLNCRPDSWLLLAGVVMGHPRQSISYSMQDTLILSVCRHREKVLSQVLSNRELNCLCVGVALLYTLSAAHRSQMISTIQPCTVSETCPLAVCVLSVHNFSGSQMPTQSIARRMALTSAPPEWHGEQHLPVWRHMLPVRCHNGVVPLHL